MASTLLMNLSLSVCLSVCLCLPVCVLCPNHVRVCRLIFAVFDLLPPQVHFVHIGLSSIKESTHQFLGSPSPLSSICFHPRYLFFGFAFLIISRYPSHPALLPAYFLWCYLVPAPFGFAHLSHHLSVISVIFLSILICGRVVSNNLFSFFLIPASIWSLQ